MTVSASKSGAGKPNLSMYNIRASGSSELRLSQSSSNNSNRYKRSPKSMKLDAKDESVYL